MTPVESFDQLGVLTVPGVLSAENCAAIDSELLPLLDTVAGTRQLLRQPWCRALAQHLGQHPLLRALLSQSQRVIQCTYFEKDVQRNWLVSLHQDLSIPVARRGEAPGWQGWSEKEGQLFVQTPAQVLASLVAVRLHLDACGPDDGPLKVLAGTHRHGVIAAQDAPAWRQHAVEHICIAQPGDVVCMRPLALHSSSKARGHSRRRVIHFVYGPSSLPDGLTWPDPP